MRVYAEAESAGWEGDCVYVAEGEGWECGCCGEFVGGGFEGVEGGAGERGVGGVGGVCWVERYEAGC